MKRKLKSVIPEIQEEISKTLSQERYEHSVRVAKYAKHLARVYGKGKKKQRLIYLAGLAHDICKELKDAEQLAIIKKCNVPISPIEELKPNLLHGKTGAYILEEKFLVKNHSVLQGIRHHTFGSPDLDAIGKIIFLADKIEPGRKFAGKYRNLVGKISLNKLLLLVVQDNILHITAKGFIVSPDTLALEKKLLKKIEEKPSLRF